MTRIVFTCIAVLLLSTAPSLAAQDIPFLTGRVVDDANIIDDAAQERLTAALKAHEDKTTNQVVVLTIPTIGSASVEEYAVKVFEGWKLGQKDKDNGVLVVVVPNDRKMRIEVGYGLEGTLPDGAAGEIIRTWMTPAFKAGDYTKGIEDGAAAIVSRLEGRGDPADRTPAAASSSSTDANGFADLSWPQRLLIGGFIYSIIGMFTVIGVMTPGVGWFLYVFLIPFWAIFPMVVIGPMNTMIQLVVYLIAFPIAKQTLKKKAWYQKATTELKSKGTTTIGGFTVSSSSSSSGSSWSSSSSGSSFSGGGSSFSGGGGSSGGGGASGSW